MKMLPALMLLLASALALPVRGQVTIGSGEEPEKDALLDLKENKAGTSGKGLLLPRVALTSTTAATPLSGHKRGMFIYNTATAGDVAPGIYYSDGEKWIPVQGGTSGTAEGNPWHTSGTTIPAKSCTESVYHVGYVTIGKDTLEASAALNVDATDKGVLLPRIPLKAADDIKTIKNPTTGMLVYNTGAEESFPVKGYMYWNGSEWRLISTSTSVAPRATIICGEATLDPEQVIQANVHLAAGTVLRIPYAVGNGGMYNAAILPSTDPTSNVKATISGGLFENGSGYLAFNVEGTPTVNQVTPTGITFDLQPFYDANPTIDPEGYGCKTVTVGAEVKADIKSVATMDNLKLVNDGGVTGYATQLTTPDGKFSVRAFIVSNDFDASTEAFGSDSRFGMNLQIRNNGATDVVIAGQFNWQWGGAGGNGANYLGLQPGLWSGDGAQSIDNASQTYWAHYVSNDQSGTGWSRTPADPTTTNKTNRGYYVFWGNDGVYALGRPERRTYSWTINDGGVSKTAYILTFSSSALNPTDAATTKTCPNGICAGTKVFMMIDQITAP